MYTLYNKKINCVFFSYELWKKILKRKLIFFLKINSLLLKITQIGHIFLSAFRL